MSRFCFILLFGLAVSAVGCGYGSHYRGGAGSPNVMSLAPNMATAGDAAFTMTVTGSNFGTDSVVFWNGGALPSSYATTTQVTATVSAADVMTAGVVPVYVRSGGQNSNMLNFTVQ
jgi:hypothetical protein